MLVVQGHYTVFFSETRIYIPMHVVRLSFNINIIKHIDTCDTTLWHS